MFACHGDPSHDTVSTCNSYATLPSSHNMTHEDDVPFNCTMWGFGVTIWRINFCFLLHFFIYLPIEPQRQKPNTLFSIVSFFSDWGLTSPGIDGTRNHRISLLCFPQPVALKLLHVRATWEAFKSVPRPYIIPVKPESLRAELSISYFLLKFLAMP